MTAVPALRFPEFDGEWEVATVGELVSRESRPVQVDPASTYRQLGIRSHGRGIFHKPEVLGEELGNKRVFEVVPDALILNIVFAWEQAVARTSRDDAAFIASHRFPMFLPKRERCDTRFLKHLFLTPRGKWLLMLASPGGAGRNKTLGQQEFLKLKVRIPSADEQSKVSDAIEILDDKIDALRRKHDGLKKFKSGLMQKLFSQELRFKRDDGSDYPDWEEKRLGELGKFAGGGTPATSNRSYWSGSIPWISSSDLTEGQVTRVKPTRFISEKAVSASATHLIPAGSILIVSRVGVGKFCLSNIAVCTSQDFSNFIPKDGAPLYLTYWLWHNRDQLLSLCQGTSIKGLTTVDLKRLSVDFPHPDEQQKIADCLSSVDAKIDAVAAQITQMEAFKKGLLQKMFV